VVESIQICGGIHTERCGVKDVEQSAFRLLRVLPKIYLRTPSAKNHQQRGGFVLAHVTVDHGVSGCFGTSLAPQKNEATRGLGK
jgi:hypothetical protein